MQDLPNSLFSAIQHAQVILSWLKNLPKDEQPPVWMWHISKEVEEWFEEIDSTRNQPRNDDDETVPLEQNEFAQGFR